MMKFRVNSRVGAFVLGAFPPDGRQNNVKHAG